MNQANRALCVELREQGMTLRAIAKQIGKSSKVVHEALARHDEEKRDEFNIVIDAWLLRPVRAA